MPGIFQKDRSHASSSQARNTTAPTKAADVLEAVYAKSGLLDNKPLQKVKQVFGSNVRIKRQGIDLQLVLEPAEANKPVAIDEDQQDSELEIMRAGLKRLLNAEPRSRQVFKHLTYFEHALKTDGLQAFQNVRLDVLQKTLLQIETLVGANSSDMLPELRSKLSFTLMEREHQEQLKTSHQPRSDFLTTKKVSVEETSVSQFLNVEKDWKGDALEASSGMAPAALK